MARMTTHDGLRTPVVVLALAAASLTLTACPPGSDPVAGLGISRVSADQAELEVTLGAESFAWTTDATSSDVACTARTLDQTACAFDGPEGDVVAGTVGFDCTVTRPGSAYQRFDVQLVLGDLRDAVVGTATRPVDAGTWIGEVCPEGGGACSRTACFTDAASPAVDVTVEEAAGGPAPWPVLVTPDFRRVIRVEFDHTLPGGDTHDWTCRETVSARGALRDRKSVV